MTDLSLSRRAVLLGSLPAACGLAQQPSRDPDTIDVRRFGASPAASAVDNSRAFAAASAAINAAGGGTLLVPPGIYRVAAQRLVGRRGAGRAFHSADIIKIERCTRPVLISGKGATLRAADGLRYGSFDPQTGAPHKPASLPFYDRDFRTDPYRMIEVNECRGAVRIEGFDLDGNMKAYVLGGEWGDTGRQLSAVGIMLQGNVGGVTIEGVTSHDHGLDGIMVVHHGLGPRSPRYPITLIDVVCDRNGRQGLSWVGGTELTALRCRFTRTGRGKVSSAPGAGVDIEAENSVCRNGRFVDCEFSDNVGVGFLADQGDTANVRLERCTFVGTTAWSAWPRKPGFVFDDCLFVGAIVQTHGDPDPRRAVRFQSCRFRADRALSPTRAVYGSTLADLGAGATNVLFTGCSFEAIIPEVALPWTPGDVRYDNCRFRQAGKVTSYPRGVFTGRCEIVSAGHVQLEGSRFAGHVTLNGRKLS